MSQNRAKKSALFWGLVALATLLPCFSGFALSTSPANLPLEADDSAKVSNVSPLRTKLMENGISVDDDPVAWMSQVKGDAPSVHGSWRKSFNAWLSFIFFAFMSLIILSILWDDYCKGLFSFYYNQGNSVERKDAWADVLVGAVFVSFAFAVFYFGCIKSYEWKSVDVAKVATVMTKGDRSVVSAVERIPGAHLEAKCLVDRAYPDGKIYAYLVCVCDGSDSYAVVMQPLVK